MEQGQWECITDGIVLGLQHEGGSTPRRAVFRPDLCPLVYTKTPIILARFFEYGDDDVCQMLMYHLQELPTVILRRNPLRTEMYRDA
jgi:hypothetical protein